MANLKYNILYERWKRYVGPRGMLNEAESDVHVDMDPAQFLELTTTPEDMARIKEKPSISEPFDPIRAGSLSIAIFLDDAGMGKVKSHEGRNRAWKALQSGAATVPVRIMVLNRKASINDINAIEGQFSNATVDRSDFKERTLQVSGADPLGIGSGKQFKGYEIRVDWSTVEGIQGYINSRYNKEPAFQKDGKIAFVDDILNKYYTVTDDTGQQYEFANSANLKVDSETGEVARVGTLSINLKPHPLTLVSPPSIQNINARTYTLKKR